MNSENEKILDIFRETGALMEGHFILRSGLHSGHFFQCARVCEHLDRVTELVEMLVKKLGDIECDTVIAPALGGLVLGQEVARQLKKRFIFAEKENGALVLRRNFKISEGEKILIVEDVITRGGRVQECIDIVKAHGEFQQGLQCLLIGATARQNLKCRAGAFLNFLSRRTKPIKSRLSLRQFRRPTPARNSAPRPRLESGAALLLLF